MSKSYPLGRDAFLSGDVDVTADTIKVVLVDTGQYTYDDAHDFLADVAAGARIATATLSNVSVASGVLDADDVNFPSVSNANDGDALIIYKDTGNESTSQLLFYIDAGGGLPVEPNGSDINLAWDNGANKIYKWGS